MRWLFGVLWAVSRKVAFGGACSGWEWNTGVHAASFLEALKKIHERSVAMGTIFGGFCAW